MSDTTHLIVDANGLTCGIDPISTVDIQANNILVCNGEFKLVPRFMVGALGLNTMSDLHNLLLLCRVNHYFVVHGEGRVLIYIKLKGWFWQRRKQLEAINNSISERRLVSMYMQAFLQPHWTVALAKTLWNKIRHLKKGQVDEKKEG